MDELTPGHGARAFASAELKQAGQLAVLSLRGELDISSVGQIRPVIDQLLEVPPERVTVNLDGLEFMDSSGIALL